MYTLSSSPSCPIFFLPYEIRSTIYTYVLYFYFSTPPYREITYTAAPQQSWDLNWRYPPLLSHIPPLERALIPYRHHFREFFALRVTQSIIVFRPAECSTKSVSHNGRDDGGILGCLSRKSIHYPWLVRQVSPLVARNMREVQYLTFVHNPLLEEICIDKNEVALELGKSLFSLANLATPHFSTLRSLTIAFRAPYYALYQKNYEFERAVLWPGLEALIKQRGVHKLVLKRDDGQGWRGTGPDFGELGEELNEQLGLIGEVEMVNTSSNIKYNRSAFPYTGVSETWEALNGGLLVWKKTKHEEQERPNLRRLISG